MRTFEKKPKTTQQTSSAKSSKFGRVSPGQSRDIHSILHLQRTIGNQAVLRLLQTTTENIDANSASRTSTGFSHDFSHTPVYPGARNTIQPKLKVNAPKDRYEQEADRIADEVLRQKVREEEDEIARIQGRASMQAAGSEREVNEDIENRLNRSKGGGSPFSDQVRAFVEPRLQFDFSKVRIHTDSEATRMNQELGARAFTHGREIYFGVGQYNSQSIEGKRLIAHELTHVVQQSNADSVSGQNSVKSHNVSKAKKDTIQCSIEPHPEISGDFIISTDEGIETEAEFIRQVRRDLGSKVMRSRLREDRPAIDLMRIDRFEERLRICWNGELSLRRPSNRQIVVRLEGWGGRVSRFILISPRVSMPSPEESREPGEETLPPLQRRAAMWQEIRSALSGAVQGPNIADILDAAFAFRLLRSPRGPLWVMDADDTYTSRVRLWGPVTNQLRVVKQHLEENCEEWRSAHVTNPSWTPTHPGLPQIDPPPHAWDDPFQDNIEAGSWVDSPPGTGAEVNQSLYREYLQTGNVPDQLWTSAIGSFGLYVTVNSISCENCNAVLNVWMYNNMDQRSFGNPESSFSAGGLAILWSGGVDAQYMWWNWTEPHRWHPR